MVPFFVTTGVMTQSYQLTGNVMEPANLNTNHAEENVGMVPFSVTTGAMTQRCSYAVSSPALRTQPTTRTSTEHVETLAWMSALHAMEHVLMECLNAMESVTTKKSLHVEVYVTQT